MSSSPPDTTAFPQILADTFRSTQAAIAGRETHDFARTVAFSMQASDAMAAVAQITGETRGG